MSRVNAPLAGICLRLIKRGVPAFIQGRDFGGEIATLAESLAEGQTTIDGFTTRVDEWETRKLGKISAHDDDDFDRKAAEITDRADCLLAFAETANRPGDIAFKIRSVFQDATGERKDCVVLSSTHRAKGLEWNRVFVLMSTYKVKSGPAPKGEDRNLTYVAWTRAKAELVLVQGEVGVTIGRRRITAENLDEHFEVKRDERDTTAAQQMLDRGSVVTPLRGEEALSFIQDRIDLEAGISEINRRFIDPVAMDHLETGAEFAERAVEEGRRLRRGR